MIESGEIMLLTEKATAIVEINKLKIELGLDFRIIENLHYALKDNVILNYLKIKEKIDFLDLLGRLEEYDERFLALFLNVSCDCKYTIIEIDRELKTLKKEEKEYLSIVLRSLIIQSLIFLNEEESTEDKKENNEEGDNNKFEKWFNYFYCLAIDKLKMTLSDFYNSTPAQIKERAYRFNQEQKKIYIMTYCDIMKARNRNRNIKIEEVEEVSDMYQFINRI